MISLFIFLGGVCTLLGLTGLIYVLFNVTQALIQLEHRIIHLEMESTKRYDG